MELDTYNTLLPTKWQWTHMVNINMNREHGYTYMVTYKNILSIEQLQFNLGHFTHMYTLHLIFRNSFSKQNGYFLYGWRYFFKIHGIWFFKIDITWTISNVLCHESCQNKPNINVITISIDYITKRILLNQSLAVICD